MLGVNAALGRTFAPEEDVVGKPVPVVVLGHALWQRRFGGRRDAIGQQVRIDGGIYTVIGVLPADFRWAGEPVAGTATEIQAWFPAGREPTGRCAARSVRFLKVAGRLKDGVKAAAAREETRRIVSGAGRASIPIPTAASTPTYVPCATRRPGGCAPACCCCSARWDSCC